MAWPWYILAIGAAVMWGVHYPLVDHALRHLSLSSVLVLTAIPILGVAMIFTPNLVRDVAVFGALPTKNQLLIVAIMFTSLAATVLIYLSIHSMNATLASMIEITYPFFVALFAFLFFRHIHINISVAIGAVLIFLGSSLIIWQNP